MLEKQKNTIKFLPRKELILPEYGRNIQQMVDYAVSIEDRQERMRCADAIINLMGRMFPYLRDVEGFKFKLWDHLAEMSQYKLDIDYPFEIIKRENAKLKHAKIPYKSERIKYLHYGKIVERFIDQAPEIEDEQKQEAFVNTIGNYMKKSLLEWNREIANDKKVIADFRELSKNQVNMPEDAKFLTLEEYRRPKQNNNNNNIRKRKIMTVYNKK
ncbi:MAG: DUF4290 domain-containing protein [Prevotellaceae bacterium]|jgi:hypothetical protein|nr:DUF4290 domain-containing protein [Prevotellaceae bacterium]